VSLLFYPNKTELALRTEIGRLQAQIRELESKAIAPQEVERLRALANEGAQFRKEAEEVHRLRGEVTLLRGEKTQLQRQAAELAQARVQPRPSVAIEAGRPGSPASAPTPAQIASRLSRGVPVTAEEESLQLRSQNQQLVLTVQRSELQQAFAALPEEQLTTARLNYCIANLKMLHGGASQWALENSKAAGSPVEVDQLRFYLKWQSLPLCPANGTYRLPAVGLAPECSVHGQLQSR